MSAVLRHGQAQQSDGRHCCYNCSHHVCRRKPRGCRCAARGAQVATGNQGRRRPTSASGRTRCSGGWGGCTSAGSGLPRCGRCIGPTFGIWCAGSATHAGHGRSASCGRASSSRGCRSAKTPSPTLSAIRKRCSTATIQSMTCIFTAWVSVSACACREYYRPTTRDQPLTAAVSARSRRRTTRSVASTAIRGLDQGAPGR